MNMADLVGRLGDWSFLFCCLLSQVLGRVFLVSPGMRIIKIIVV